MALPNHQAWPYPGQCLRNVYAMLANWRYLFTLVRIRFDLIDLCLLTFRVLHRFEN